MVLPDGITKDATPCVDNLEYYEFAVGANKHYIELVKPSGNPTNAPSGEDRLVYNASRPGVLTVTFIGRLTDYGPAWVLTNRVKFDADDIPGSTKTWDVANPGGRPIANGSDLTATLYYTTLPENNSAFGLKFGRMTLDGAEVDQKCFWAFYDADAYNWPGCRDWISSNPEAQIPDIDKTRQPNYFHYYMQTEAKVESPDCNSPTFNFRASGTVHPSNPLSNPPFPYQLEIKNDRKNKRILSPGVNANQQLEYIDRFAWAARHERTHHDSFHTWWTTGSAPRVWSSSTDGDVDYIPDELEPGMSAELGGPFVITMLDTYRGDELFDDDERHTCMTAAEWTPNRDGPEGSDPEDWAMPGNNWQD